MVVTERHFRVETRVAIGAKNPMAAFIGADYYSEVSVSAVVMLQRQLRMTAAAL
jgi:hypothetical protein